MDFPTAIRVRVASIGPPDQHVPALKLLPLYMRLNLNPWLPVLRVYKDYQALPNTRLIKTPRIESWRQAVVPYEHGQQALVPFEQPRKLASTIKYPEPDKRAVLSEPPEEAASCSALVPYRRKESQQSSSAPPRDDQVARKHHAKPRSECSQSSSGRSSGSSRATSIDGHRSERQERPRPRQPSHGSRVRTQRPLSPLSPHPPPQFQAPPEPTSAARYPQRPPPLPQPGPYCQSYPPPTYPQYTPIYSPKDEIPEFEREKLVTTQRLVEVNERLRVEMERHNDNVDAMRYRASVCYPGFAFLPNYNI